MSDVWADINKEQPEEGEKIIAWVPLAGRSETWVYSIDVLHQLRALKALWISMPKPTDKRGKE